MAQNLIPERGWHPMVDAERDVNRAYVVRYHEHNKSSGPYRVQFARWLPNAYGEWAWRPCWRPDGGEVYAEGWMDPQEFQAACEALASEQTPEFDL